MRRMELETAIQVFERTKTVHSLHRAATVIGRIMQLYMYYKNN
jgi:hypothetical protein